MGILNYTTGVAAARTAAEMQAALAKHGAGTDIRTPLNDH